MAFDRHMNLVLGDAEEFRQLPPKKGVAEEDREERRLLGLVILRGDEVIDLMIEGPPPADETRLAKQQAAPAGPGMGRAAGRGMPVAAPGQAPPGLAGPAAGFGGPAPGSMMPRPQMQARAASWVARARRGCGQAPSHGAVGADDAVADSAAVAASGAC